MRKTYIKFLEPYEKKLAKKIKKRGLTITVSGLSGAGKTVASESIAKAFKLRHVEAGEIFRKVAKERGLELQEFSKIREKEVDYEIEKRTLKFAMEGNVVLNGRLTAWVAGDWADVKIFYDCPLKVRAERVAKRDKIPFEKAMRTLKERDKADREKYLKLYGIDSFDKSIYDIVIDNEKLTLEEARELPIKLIREFLDKKLSLQKKPSGR